MTQSTVFLRKDIEDLWRLVKTEAMVTLEHAPFQSLPEALFYGRTTGALDDSDVISLWGAGVRDRAKFQEAAQLKLSPLVPDDSGRNKGLARFFLFGHALGNLHVLKESAGPGYKEGGNGSALLKELDGILDAGHVPIFRGISVSREVHTKPKNTTYTFVRDGHVDAAISRTRLLATPMQKALGDILSLLEISRSVYFPLKWQRRRLALDHSADE